MNTIHTMETKTTSIKYCITFSAWLCNYTIFFFSDFSKTFHIFTEKPLVCIWEAGQMRAICKRCRKVLRSASLSCKSATLLFQLIFQNASHPLSSISLFSEFWLKLATVPRIFRSFFKKPVTIDDSTVLQLWASGSHKDDWLISMSKLLYTTTGHAISLT